MNEPGPPSPGSAGRSSDAPNPERLLLDALAWLETTYHDHRFFNERDLVWTLQRWLPVAALNTGSRTGWQPDD